ncbi:MAG: signal peptidase I [Bacilli bacterium]|nr:signal peptidase I [Bacilli bacterium]
MKKIKKENNLILPTTLHLKSLLIKEKHKLEYVNLFKVTLFWLILFIALTTLISSYFFPILKISGDSMKPTLNQNDITLCIKKNKYKSKDIIAFYYNNQILIKRVIATSFDWVNIDEEGNVYINNVLLKEPYIKLKQKGESDIAYPYQVPENSYFVLGDNRENSIDSRYSVIGSVKNENVIGKVIFNILPINKLKYIK